jgi:hypothetical protein
MEKITVDKNELLAQVRANRDNHRQIFLEALEGYRQQGLRELEELVKDLRNGKTPQIVLSIDRPQDHTRDYDRVIAMLEMHKGDEFIVSETDFAQYALDDWNWKRQWALSNSGYVSAGTRKAHTDYFES